jgi:hypothetical protein
MAQLDPFDSLEELSVALVGAGPSALDITNAQVVQALGNLQLIGNRQRNVFGLAAIA